MQGAGGVAPFGVIAGASCDIGDLVGWSIVTGGKLLDATVAGAETYTAAWFVDPTLVLADDFTLGEVDVEVWAIMDIGSGLVAPRVTLSAIPEAGLSWGAQRYTAEWGSGGYLLTLPSSGTRPRPTRLGTLTFPVDPLAPARWKMRLAASTAAGSSGQFGCSQLVCVLSRYRASSPSGKSNDATYPAFTSTSSESAKTITSDLRGLLAKPPLPPVAHRGVGGSPLELPPGDTDILLFTSSVVPDDPTIDAVEHHAADVWLHVSVWPRWHAYRPS